MPANPQARLSEGAFTNLVKRAEQDGVLAEKVGQRTDIPPRLFRQLLMQASEVVQKRLLAQAKPETQAEIRRVLAEVTDEVGAKAAPRNYAAALAAVRALHKERKLTEADIVDLRRSRQIRRDHRRARDLVRGAGRGGRPLDEWRTRRSGADPGALGQFRLADGQGGHRVAARDQTVAARRSTPRYENFERLTAADRAARRALLAGAAGHWRSKLSYLRTMLVRKAGSHFFGIMRYFF